MKVKILSLGLTVTMNFYSDCDTSYLIDTKYISDAGQDVSRFFEDQVLEICDFFISGFSLTPSAFITGIRLDNNSDIVLGTWNSGNAALFQTAIENYLTTNGYIFTSVSVSFPTATVPFISISGTDLKPSLLLTSDNQNPPFTESSCSTSSLVAKGSSNSLEGDNYIISHCSKPEQDLVKQCYALADTVEICDWRTQYVTAANDTILNFSYYDENGILKTLENNPNFNFPYDANTEYLDFIDDLNNWLSVLGFSGYFEVANFPSPTNFWLRNSYFIPRTIELKLASTSTFTKIASTCRDSVTEDLTKIEAYYYQDSFQYAWMDGVYLDELPSNAVSIGCENFQPESECLITWHWKEVCLNDCSKGQYMEGVDCNGNLVEGDGKLYSTYAGGSYISIDENCTVQSPVNYGYGTNGGSIVAEWTTNGNAQHIEQTPPFVASWIITNSIDDVNTSNPNDAFMVIRGYLDGVIVREAVIGNPAAWTSNLIVNRNVAPFDFDFNTNYNYGSTGCDAVDAFKPSAQYPRWNNRTR